MEELIDGQEDDDRLQKGELKVSSAGLFAVEGDEANEDALEALEKLYKIKGEKHKARKPLWISVYAMLLNIFIGTSERTASRISTRQSGM